MHISPTSIINKINQDGPVADKEVIARAVHIFGRVPDGLMTFLVVREMQKRLVNYSSKVFILDGFPSKMMHFDLFGPVSVVSLVSFHPGTFSFIYFYFLFFPLLMSFFFGFSAVG